MLIEPTVPRNSWNKAHNSAAYSGKLSEHGKRQPDTEARARAAHLHRLRWRGGYSGQQLMRTALAQFKDAGAIDLIGRLLSRLTHVVGQEPLGQPGLYRQMHQDYFERVEAIEFTVAHNDGRNPHEWRNAEIVPAWR